MSNFGVGHSFSTGNSVVATLPVGSVLEVVGQGQLEIVDMPPQTFDAGDRVMSKYGPGTVVRVTNRDGIDKIVANAAGERIVYIADGTNVVRVAEAENLSRI